MNLLYNQEIIIQVFLRLYVAQESIHFTAIKYRYEPYIESEVQNIYILLIAFELFTHKYGEGQHRRDAELIAAAGKATAYVIKTLNTHAHTPLHPRQSVTWVDTSPRGSAGNAFTAQYLSRPPLA